MLIKIDNVTGHEVISFVNEHLHSMTLMSPPESIHALDAERLRGPEMTFWSAWEGNELAGCGALKELDSRNGEIKSMRTAASHLRKGVAKQVLKHILSEARKRDYERVSLETGSMASFEPARKLYESFGFQYCEPFADYVEDPNSVFMTKKL
ncbi:GNAT family N-acetyltransferase [Bacillus sp. SW14]|uniref:GNAT family N-acetyltransferase n=1 Tax=Bacillus sp. SW14 TaxID=3391618 RepID=UPI0039E3A938